MAYNDAVACDAFRPGMLPLRDMKKHWTIGEFMDLDASFNFRIKAGGPAMAAGTAVNQMELDSFQSYLREFDFRICRVGFLYGSYELVEGMDKKTPLGSAGCKVNVAFIYEPPQSGDELHFELNDSDEAQAEVERAEKLAGMLGVQRVGWIFSTPPREDGFQLNCEEIIMAGELQLEAAQGVEDTSFVTIKATVNDKGETSVDAFQVSRQAMEMCAEGALEPSSKPGFCKVSSTFTAIVEGKEAKEIDNNFMLSNVPITFLTESKFVSSFPKRNRDGRAQTHDEVRKQLSKSGTNGWTFTDLLSDFQLLLYLTEFLDMDSIILGVASSIVEKRDVDDGYKIMVSSLVGLEGY
jgi:nuclear protein localization family protein 4